MRLELEHEGHITSGWSVSENNHKATYYRLTPIEKEIRACDQTATIFARVLAPATEHS